MLDLCKRSAGQSASHALDDTIALARSAERAGYDRFWIAEHHTDDAAQSSPEVLLPLLASATTTLRVGAGGILLQYYSPLKVAETFLMLEALFPGRIDLGICRGPGVMSNDVARALVGGHDDELGESSFEAKAADLVRLLREPAVVAHETVVARPLGVAPPPIWILGGGATSARLGASLGTHYAYSLFFGGGLTHGPALLADYRKRFTPCPNGQMPKGAIALSVISARDAAAAARIDDELVAQGAYKSNLVGTPAQCAEAIRSFAEWFGVADVLLATFVRGAEARRDLYALLAEALLP